MVTIKLIAQEVGISSSTVSIVLGGKAAERKISTATQEKIFAAAVFLREYISAKTRKTDDRRAENKFDHGPFTAVSAPVRRKCPKVFRPTGRPTEHTFQKVRRRAAAIPPSRRNARRR